MEQIQASFQSLTTVFPRALIRGYQFVTSGMVHRCRFYPSCSEYAQEALRLKGLFHGLWAALVRILKCHPWHPGGYDPVH
ncbi:MAG: membrane protein insertion efficiency factor YidD [Elusimicrobiota bacterium]